MALVLDGTNGVSGVDGTASNPSLEGTDSNTGVFFPAADTVAIGTGGTEALRVDSARNVGIGTTSPAAKFEVSTGGSTVTRFTSTIDNNVNIDFYTNSVYRGIIQFNSLNGLIYTIPSIPLIFGTNNAERARITSGGRFQVGSSGTSDIGIDLQQANTAAIININGRMNNSGTTTTAIQFKDSSAATNIGTITVTASAVAYNTTSDYRLKENVQPMTGALEKIAALKPCTYIWKSTGKESQGFIAHELQAVVPDCVTGEKDAVDTEGNPIYQGVDTSFLVATLTAAIQEQQAMIDELKAKVAALENA